MENNEKSQQKSGEEVEIKNLVLKDTDEHEEGHDQDSKIPTVEVNRNEVPEFEIPTQIPSERTSEIMEIKQIRGILKESTRSMKLLQSPLVEIYYRAMPRAYDTNRNPSLSELESMEKSREKDVTLAKELLKRGSNIQRQMYGALLEIQKLGFPEEKVGGCIRFTQKNLTALSYQVGALNAFIAFPCLCAFPGRDMRRKIYCRTNCTRKIPSSSMSPIAFAFSSAFWPEITRVYILLHFFIALEALYLLAWSLPEKN